MMKNNKHVKREKGISLLIVLLIGSIILLTSVTTGAYAIRMVKTLRSRGDAVQALYTAEQTFNCVKYWLNKDVRRFSDQADGDDIVCNEQTYNFNPESGGASFNALTNVGSFTIDTDLGEVYVEVEHDSVDSWRFVGTIRLYSRTGPLGKVAERFQEYRYTLLEGADIMFVVDRSGSIEGDRATPTAGEEWGKMVISLRGAINALSRNVPAPHMGIVSFGNDATDVGKKVGNLLEPEVPLTDNRDVLIDPITGWPNIETTVADTNLSLGISVAGAELMGKAYPFAGLTTVNPTDGTHTGAFEWIVAGGGGLGPDDFADLPDSTSLMDRNDAEYPDVIVLISDGAPNVIMTHEYMSPKWWWAPNDLDSDFFADDAETHEYEVGEAKRFRTSPSGILNFIIDDGSTGLPNDNQYTYCNDELTDEPNDVFSEWALKTKEFPHFAMCNGTLIADKLKEVQTFGNNKKILFIVVFVGDAGASTEEILWLEEYIASEDPTDPGLKLFEQVDDFEGVRDAVLGMFRKVVFVENL